MSEERLVRVENFSELQAGMLVVVKACTTCGKTHRSILTRFVKRVLFRSGRVDPGWRGLPRRPCSKVDCNWANVSPLAVGEGRCFMVITDEPKSQETKRAKVKERVR